MSKSEKVSDKLIRGFAAVFVISWASGIFIIGAISLLLLVSGTVAFASAYPKMLPAWLGILAIGALILWFVFRCRRPVPFEKLKKKGLVESREYEAIRAFAVHQTEDEGNHYFVELADGGVLFSFGYIAEEHQDGEEEDSPDNPRKFPSSRFVVHRHRKAGVTVKIEPTGTILPLDGVAPCFGEGDDVPVSGDIIRDRTYDEIKAERFGSGSSK